MRRPVVAVFALSHPDPCRVYLFGSVTCLAVGQITTSLAVNALADDITLSGEPPSPLGGDAPGRHCEGQLPAWRARSFLHQLGQGKHGVMVFFEEQRFPTAAVPCESLCVCVFVCVCVCVCGLMSS